jgi:hypothetical protein
LAAVAISAAVFVNPYCDRVVCVATSPPKPFYFGAFWSLLILQKQALFSIGYPDRAAGPTGRLVLNRFAMDVEVCVLNLCWFMANY